MNSVYFDHAATTPTDPEVFEAMRPFFTDYFYNASSIYGPANEVREWVEESRWKVATLLNARPEEIYFTSGATESNNWAVKGIALAYEGKGRHIITSSIEHHALLEPCQFLEKRGWEVTYLPVDRYGRVDPEDVVKALRPDTVLVSIMMANNEVGTIEPVAEIGAICRERKVPFHTDAVQAVGKIPVDVQEIQCDLLSLSGHKIYGPKGIGALYVRKGIRIRPLIEGGGQEHNYRSGTLNVPGIIGLGKAVELAGKRREEETLRLRGLRDRLIQGLISIPGVTLTGHPVHRLPNHVSLCVEGAEGEALLLALDEEGFCVSSGPACSSGSAEPSHVLLAMGYPVELARGALRITLGRSNTQEEVEAFLALFPRVLERFRQMGTQYDEVYTPVYE